MLGALLGENLFKIKIQNCSEEIFSKKSFKILLRGKLFKIKIQNSARRKAFENQNSKFLCPGQTTICLIFVGCNQIMVIKEVCAIIALTIDRNNTPEIKYRRKKEIAAAQNPFPADQSSKFSPGRGNELEIERD